MYKKNSESEKSTAQNTLNSDLHEQSVTNASRYDYLTGLPSMTYFFELAEAAVKDMLKNNLQPMLLYTDFSGMKFFNTKQGFSSGDKMLQDYACLLTKTFGNDNCCRIASDHFAVICENKELEKKLNIIFEEFGSLFDGKTPPVHVGIYPYGIEEVSVSTACDRAKLACSMLKGSYASVLSYYNAELREQTVLKQYIIENFETALREKWIHVYLQPIVRAVNEQVCDVEALARWIDPVKGLLNPGNFIPILEETRQIYKLDLYVLDQVLESIKIQKEKGFFILPHSINLSRSDFDCCDIVEEIRQRVDAAGVSRDRITVEVTESTIGNNFDFMKKQIERFQDLGFSVWMDDFGSGYSSLDALQSIQFDLLKFDMSFMRKLDENGNSRIVLTELMRMATSLGADTVCEGVEKESQVRFLREIGCSKLQGFYYSKPVSFEEILEMHENSALMENEWPEESDYYESIGRVNLFDLGVIASEDENALQNTFNTIPIAVLEVKDDLSRYARTNRSYQDFFNRFFHIDLLKELSDFKPSANRYSPEFFSVLKQCCKNGNQAFFDEKMPNGSIVHFFVRRVNTNPVTGTVAVVLAVLSISDPDENTTYADIARALASDYYNIFVIDLDTNHYVEYSSQVGGEELSTMRQGEDFFESAKHDTMTRIYEDDREPFLKWFTKENVLHELNTQGVFTTTYRLIDTGTPMYVNMKITRMQGGNRIILGISIIDAQMKQQEEEKKLRKEKIALGRIAALSPNYIVLYTVDPVTGHYTQYNPSNEFSKIGLAIQGNDFFTDVVLDAPKAIAPEDLERHLRVFTKENVMREIRKNGFYLHSYRLIIDGKTTPVTLRATLIEDEGEKILLGVTYENKEEYRRTLEEAYENVREISIINSHIAQALARGYTDLYYVNMDSDELIEYHTDDELGVLTEARRGSDFFEGCERDAKLFVHPDDVETFVNTMNRKFLAKALEQSRIYEFTYRRIKDGRTFYVKMRISRIEEDKRFIVIAVSDIDELMRQRFAEKRIQEERLIYARLHAITGNFIVVYVVDPETDHYREFSSTDIYEESFSQAKTGTDFFKTVREVALQFNHPEDLSRFLAAFTKENMMAEIDRSGIFTLGYRLMMDGKPLHVQMKAALVEESEGTRLIVGLNNIDAAVRQEEEFERRLFRAQAQANIDALTGIKNKHAYLEFEARMNQNISEHLESPFAITILDVNDLKLINDTNGHQAGDQYLRDACKIICNTFKHSPVFRVGGDEFAVISQGTDYENIEELLEKMNVHNEEALKTEGVVIACGMARFDNDTCVASVFERADHKMYEAKVRLKSLHEDTISGV